MPYLPPPNGGNGSPLWNPSFGGNPRGSASKADWLKLLANKLPNSQGQSSGQGTLPLPISQLINTGMGYASIPAYLGQVPQDLDNSRITPDGSYKSDDPTNATVAEYNLLGPNLGGMVGNDQTADAGDPSYIDTIMAELNKLAGASGGGIDSDQMIRDASAGINKAYGAQIAAIKHQNAGAREDTGADSKEVRRMYRLLAKSQTRQAKRSQSQGEAVADKLQNMGNAAAQANNDAASKILNVNAAAGAALGSPEMAADLNAGVEQRNQKMTAANVAQAQRDSSMMVKDASNAREFFNEASGSARVEGTNRAADMYAQLEDYLQANRDKIAGVAGQRASALASAKNSILQQAAASQDRAAQQLFGNKRAVAEMFLGQYNKDQDRNLALQRLLASAASAQGGGDSTVDPYALLPKNQGDAQRLLDKSGSSSDVRNYFNDISNGQEFQLGYAEGDHNTQLPIGNPAVLNAVIKQYLGPKYAQLSSADQAALLNALIYQAQGVRAASGN